VQKAYSGEDIQVRILTKDKISYILNRRICMKGYKVLTQKGKFWSKKFDKGMLVKALNT
jgi:hypothetical protein